MTQTQMAELPEPALAEGPAIAVTGRPRSTT